MIIERGLAHSIPSSTRIRFCYKRAKMQCFRNVDPWTMYCTIDKDRKQQAHGLLSYGGVAEPG